MRNNNNVVIIIIITGLCSDIWEYSKQYIDF